ncbi:hypothetical protein F511_14499 [Dorcoceras hygrometricum]|uniref:Uncharacterized protein n=1 Tax=Dorcoceras hygrometricum TaxID=472368 RepID=A0A2Z7AX02_9LAMI|nr:hypothetical protein F511_14499 [Dorcoceras hygrometricum]
MCQLLAHIVAHPAIIIDHRVAQPVRDVQPSPLIWRAAHGRTLLRIAQHMAQQLAPDDAHPFRAAACHWQAFNSATSCAEQASDRPLLRVGRACAHEEERRRHPNLGSDTTVGEQWCRSGSRLPGRSGKQNYPGDDQYNFKTNTIRTIHRVFSLITLLATCAWLQPELQERRLFTVGGGRFVNQVHDRKRSPSDQPALED